MFSSPGARHRFFVLTLVGVAIAMGYADTAKGAEREGAFTLINLSDVDIPIQAWGGRYWENETIPKKTRFTYWVELDRNGRSKRAPTIRFNNGRGKIRTYELDFYEIQSRKEEGMLYQFEYDQANGWDLKKAD